MLPRGSLGFSSNASSSAFSLGDLRQVMYASVSSTVTGDGNIAYFIGLS